MRLEVKDFSRPPDGRIISAARDETGAAGGAAADLTFR
jgi:hypothetical protein